MAAILCQGIGNLCSGACELLTLPCRLCGTACQETCKQSCRALTSPFFPYLAVTFGLCLPPAVWGFKAYRQYQDDGCPTLWLTVNAVLCILHIVAALYITHRIQEDRSWQHETYEASDFVVMESGTSSSTTEKKKSSPFRSLSPLRNGNAQKSRNPFAKWYQDSQNGGGANSVQRLGSVLCYDAGVAIYIIVFAFWVCWQSYGIQQVLGNDELAECDAMRGWTVWSVVLGWMYLMLVVTSFCCSLICLR